MLDIENIKMNKTKFPALKELEEEWHMRKQRFHSSAQIRELKTYFICPL